MRITLTIQELTAKLGYMKYAGAFMGKDNQPILSFIRNEPFILPRAEFTVGSKWEMDECEHCGKSENAHSKWVHYVAQPEHMRNDKSFPFPCDEFKPLLAKITAIRLTERCENCGETAEKFDGLVQSVLHNSKCKQFKPVQTVEINLEVD